MEKSGRNKEWKKWSDEQLKLFNMHRGSSQMLCDIFPNDSKWKFYNFTFRKGVPSCQFACRLSFEENQSCLQFFHGFPLKRFHAMLEKINWKFTLLVDCWDRCWILKSSDDGFEFSIFAISTCLEFFETFSEILKSWKMNTFRIISIQFNLFCRYMLIGERVEVSSSRFYFEFFHFQLSRFSKDFKNHSMMLRWRNSPHSFSKNPTQLFLTIEVEKMSAWMKILK